MTANDQQDGAAEDRTVESSIDRRSVLGAIATAAASSFAAGNVSGATSTDPATLVDQLSLAEKTQFTSGVFSTSPYAIGYLPGLSRLGIPESKITDGPLGVIGKTATNYGASGATAFPANLGVAATFDTDLASQEGTAIAREAKAVDQDQLYAPSMNIGRYPGCGRLFDYYSGDPHLSGQIGANFGQAVQEEGIVATAKHFVANNQDEKRKNRNEIIGERALREIYLAGFKTALLEGGIGAVMAAYNRVNGTFCTENAHLLQDILRDEWDWDGYVLSDYCAVHGTVDPATNGLDVSTGCAGDYFGDTLRTAVQNGQVAESTVDRKVTRVLRQFDRTGHLDGAKNGDPAAINTTAHQDLAREIAEAGSVLLQNDGTLPLDAGEIDDLAVLGHQNGQALVSDSLSSDVDPPYQVAPSDAVWDRASASTTIHYNDVTAARNADVAIVYAGEEVSEGVDRPNIDLPSGQNSTIQQVADQNPNTVVVLRTPGPVEMPWIDDVAAVVEMWYPGMEDGNAAVNVLFGDTDPGGKLPITFGERFEDYPAHENPEYPGVEDASGTLNAEYTEGVFVDYRWFDRQGIEPLFPFGHGESYTSFSFSNLSAPASATFGDTVSVAVDVTNTGGRTGTEVVQLYVEDVSASVDRPPKELKGFEKVELGAGETTTVTLTLDRDDFTFWDPDTDAWVAENGQFRLHVGASSRDVRQTATVDMSGGTDEGSGGSGITSGATYRITNVNSGKALDVQGGSTSDGANVQQWAYAGGTNQQWTVTETGNGVYRLTNVNSGKVLDVASGSTSDGTNVQQWADFGSDNQRFRIESAGSGYRIVAVHSDKVLDVANGSTGDGANVQQWADTGGDNQRWEFTQL